MQAEKDQHKAIKGIIMQACPDIYFRSDRGERSRRKRQTKEEERKQWVFAIQTMFEETIGSQMRKLKKYHEIIAGNLRDIHKNDRTEGQNELVNFYNQILEEIKETAEAHARRMAEVLRAMHVDRIEAEKRRREAVTEDGDEESEMVMLDSIIEAQGVTLKHPTNLHSRY